MYTSEKYQHEGEVCGSVF